MQIRCRTNTQDDLLQINDRNEQDMSYADKENVSESMTSLMGTSSEVKWKNDHS